MDDRLIGYENLAIAVVQLAVHDYRFGSKRWKDNAEKFFLSDWCEELTGIEGRKILKRLRRERHEKITEAKGTRPYQEIWEDYGFGSCAEIQDNEAFSEDL